MSLALTISELVESYREYLQLHEAANPKLLALTRFDQRLASCAEAARAEAAAFEFLRSRNLEPHLFEDPVTGGVDFECRPHSGSFAVEVTALQDDTVSQRSGVENETFGAGYVDMSETVALLRSRLSKKASQASRYKGPRVLVIASTHIASSMLFGTAAEELLTGESQIVVPVGPHGATGEIHMGTELKNAAALRSVDGAVEVFRRKYALVLLLALHGNGCHVYGIAHPEPEHALDISTFPRVPFARLVWPIVENTLRVEWIVADPHPEQHYFLGIQPTTEELKQGVS